jgi:crossover junction endodeoxyribonuclease RusA
MFTLYLPYPPSVNGLYSGKARRFKSPKYKEWLKLAGLQNKREGEIVLPPYAVTYTFKRPDKRKRDVANLEKAVSDFLVSCKFIEDDHLIDRITLQWGEFNAPEWVGVKCEITTMEK